MVVSNKKAATRDSTYHSIGSLAVYRIFIKEYISESAEFFVTISVVRFGYCFAIRLPQSLHPSNCRKIDLMF